MASECLLLICLMAESMGWFHMQMLELPRDGEGLGWIASQGPPKLLLIPGLQTASITAAAAGDADALAYVRFTAQQFAAMGSHNQTPLDTVCTAASKISSSDEHAQFLAELGSKKDLRPAYLARKASTHRLLRYAAQEGQVAALQWLRALCHRTWQMIQGSWKWQLKMAGSVP